MLKNTAGQGVYVYAVTTATGVALEGDAANITATISKDGAADGATNDVNPTEIGGGLYWFNLTQAETNAGSLAIIPVSGTSGIVLDPVTFETDLTASIIFNNKVLEKVGSVWYLRVYAVGDTPGTPTILNKALKDSTGADISDLAAGVLAEEIASTV